MADLSKYINKKVKSKCDQKIRVLKSFDEGHLFYKYEYFLDEAMTQKTMSGLSPVKRTPETEKWFTESIIQEGDE